MELEEKVKKILSMFYNDRVVRRKLPTHMKTTGRAFTIAKLLKKHNDVDIATKVFREKLEKDKKKGTLEGYIERYGEIDGPTKYYEKNSKLSVGEDSLRARGKSDEEIITIKSRHSKNSAITLKNMESRYGDSAKELFGEWKASAKKRSVRCAEYWINLGYSEDDARRLVSDAQRRDLKFFLDAGWTDDDYLSYCSRKTYKWGLSWYEEYYGPLEGRARYFYNRSKGSKKEWFFEKYGEDEGALRFISMLQQKAVQGRDSKIQIKFSEMIYDKLDSSLKQKFWGAPITKGFFINFRDNEYGIRCCVPDIRIHNIIIEFDGTYWHSKPEAIQRDGQKEILLSQIGYQVLRIPEGTFNADQIGTIEWVMDYIKTYINPHFKHELKGQQNENC